MKYGHNAICINPNTMMTPVGYMQRQNPNMTTKGDLFARAFYLEDQEKFCFITLDSFGVSSHIQKLFEQSVQEVLGKDVTLILSSSHTHHAPSLTHAFGHIKPNDSYAKFVQSRIRVMLMNMKIREGHVKADNLQMNQTLIGRNRISAGGDDYVILHLLRFTVESQRIGNFIIYNCHPTITDAQAPYFTSDYVGVTLETLNRKYPGEFFMFFQGPAGDISTRFTRKDKTYEEVIRMGKALADSVISMMKHPSKARDLNLKHTRHQWVANGHLKNPSEYSVTLPASEREIQEFEHAKTVISEWAKFPELLSQNITIDVITLGLSTLYFHPFELFSTYTRYLPVNGILIGYSQGYAGYMSDIDFEITSYETLLEIYDDQHKQKLIDLLKIK